MKTLKYINTQITDLVWYAANYRVYNIVYGSVNANVFYRRTMSLFENQQPVAIKWVIEDYLNK
jgi:hypothetical protein